MPALQVAKKYQKSGISGLQSNFQIMQNTVNQLDAEYLEIQNSWHRSCYLIKYLEHLPIMFLV
jgi:hypothetical protein